MSLSWKHYVAAGLIGAAGLGGAVGGWLGKDYFQSKSRPVVYSVPSGGKAVFYDGVVVDGSGVRVPKEIAERFVSDFGSQNGGNYFNAIGNNASTHGAVIIGSASASGVQECTGWVLPNHWHYEIFDVKFVFESYKAYNDFQNFRSNLFAKVQYPGGSQPNNYWQYDQEMRNHMLGFRSQLESKASSSCKADPTRRVILQAAVSELVDQYLAMTPKPVPQESDQAPESGQSTRIYGDFLGRGPTSGHGGLTVQEYHRWKSGTLSGGVSGTGRKSGAGRKDEIYRSRPSQRLGDWLGRGQPSGPGGTVREYHQRGGRR